MSLNDITKRPFSQGTESVERAISELTNISRLLPERVIPKFQHYINSAKKTLPLCYDFIDTTYKNKKYGILKIFTDFMLKYPTIKRNLAKPDQLTAAFIQFYVETKQNKIKKYNKDKDPEFKFLVSNSVNIYNTLSLYNHLLNASKVVINNPLVFTRPNINK